METTPSTGQLMAENEKLRQELHIVKSMLDVSEMTAAHLSDELEQLQERSTEKIDQIRTQYESQQKSHKSLIEHLKATIAEQDNITKQCSSNIPAAKTPITTLDSTLSQQKLEWEVKEAQYVETIELLKQKLAGIENNYAEAQFKISKFSESAEIALEQLTSLKENLLIKTEEIIELRELLDAAQEQNSTLSAELAGIRSNPGNANQKGNSLFAEVADQRKTLLKDLKQIKMRYFDLKIEHENCPRQIRELRNMHEQTERLYEQCMSQIKGSGCNSLQTLKEQINDMHEQMQIANSRIRYLEDQLAAKDADWLHKLIMSNREHMQKLEAQLQICRLKQREAMELHESAVKSSWMWQIEVQRMKLKALTMEVPCETPTSNDEEATASGVRASDMKNHEKDSITKEEDSNIIVNDRENHEKDSLTKEDDSASSTKVNDRANHEKNSKDKDEDNHTQHARYPSDDAAYDTNRINIEATVSPTYSGELQESKKEQQQVLPKVTKIASFKCYKISDMIAMNKEREKLLANKPNVDATGDLRTENSESKQMTKK